HQADMIAQYLRIRQLNAESYHAGKEPKERQQIQDQFMSGKTKILVATVAFGLGLNKSNVRSVIHFNMPKSLENYVQEIGRSGRDGLPANCHLFLAKSDYIKHRSFAFSESIHAIFISTNSPMSKKVKNSTGERSFALSISKAEKDFDIKESVLVTLFSYLQLEDDSSVKIYNDSWKTLRTSFVRTAPHLLAETSPIVKSIMQNVTDRLSNNILEVETFSICNDLNISPQELFAELYDLEKKKELKIEKLDKCFHIQILKQWDSEEEIIEFVKITHLKLLKKIQELEESRVSKLDECYEAFRLSSFDSLYDIESFGLTKPSASVGQKELTEDKQRMLNNRITAYFSSLGGDIKNVTSKYGFRDPEIVLKQKEG
ncbi:hypothetical protein HK096_002291, partial [Nowakowskiella sp. JEL0078]